MIQPRNLKRTKLRDLSLDDTVYCHLSGHIEVTEDFYLNSTLQLVELEMRQSRSRQMTANYAPLLTAFSILDQIGSCYADCALPAHPAGGSSIHRALYYFGGMPPLGDDVKAIYALRNGLVHDGSLTCETRSGDWYFFRYDHAMPLAIKQSVVAWDGTAEQVGPNVTTWINPRVFTDLVSTVIHNIRKCFHMRNSDLVVHPGKTDLLHKYILWDGIPDDHR